MQQCAMGSSIQLGPQVVRWDGIVLGRVINLFRRDTGLFDIGCNAWSK
jgi:hypothetical protein